LTYAIWPQGLVTIFIFFPSTLKTTRKKNKNGNKTGCLKYCDVIDLIFLVQWWWSWTCQRMSVLLTLCRHMTLDPRWTQQLREELLLKIWPQGLVTIFIFFPSTLKTTRKKNKNGNKPLWYDTCPLHLVKHDLYIEIYYSVFSNTCQRMSVLLTLCRHMTLDPRWTQQLREELLLN
jgi:uncharacterized protein with PQ loop repeat